MANGEPVVETVVIVEEVVNMVKLFLMLIQFYEHHFMGPRRRRRIAIDNRRRYSMIARIPDQIKHLSKLINISDQTCVENLRMDRNAFGRLCYLLQHLGGLEESRNVSVSEQVAIFLSVLAHHAKNSVVKGAFDRSGETVSKHFNRVLDVVLKLYTVLAVEPTAVDETSTDATWKWFKGCLGALDGTYVKVKVPLTDKPRYRNRKGEASVNVLGVCDRNLKFIFILTGWEGSAADSRVLRDAVTRTNGLSVPVGKYYLCDCGYTNGPGFLTPYRGVRYHLKEWSAGGGGPQNYKELYNLRHAKARNVIERSFGILKMRWAILRSPAFYSITTQNKIIMAACLLHNFIRTTMPDDPSEAEYDTEINAAIEEPGEVDEEAEEFIDQVQPTPQWTDWRDSFALDMYNEYLGGP